MLLDLRISFSLNWIVCLQKEFFRFESNSASQKLFLFSTSWKHPSRKAIFFKHIFFSIKKKNLKIEKMKVFYFLNWDKYFKEKKIRITNMLLLLLRTFLMFLLRNILNLRLRRFIIPMIFFFERYRQITDRNEFF